jgi:mannose-6-phosphate isomerase-like protein (cupin superfamily)
MKIIIGDRAYTLKTVDSIYFKSTVPHKWENVGEEEILGFWAVSPPSF